MASFNSHHESTTAERKNISPATQSLLALHKFDNLSTLDDITSDIWSLQTSSFEYFGDANRKQEHEFSDSSHQKPPYILYNRPVAFAIPKDKKPWRRTDSKYGKFSCFADFLGLGVARSDKQEHVARIAMFITKGDKVRGMRTQATHAHAWVAIYAKTRKGHELWIFDPTLEHHRQVEEVGIYDLEDPMQIQFISYCEEKFDMTFDRAWIKGHLGGKAFGKGVQHCTKFLDELFQLRWTDWPWTPAKSRSLGFIPLARELTKSELTAQGASSDHNIRLSEDYTQYRVRHTPPVRRRSASPDAGPSRTGHRRQVELPSNVPDRNGMVSKSTQTTLEGKDFRYISGYMFGEA